ncbi:extracellular solute-binding protein [Paenibacillus eucommiae]|uniref:ABC-type glycerol-3-phosphate transport system substrate-binding protein n=1 Tax=Paenibacillus eucommiae TaxID=1355755 RepID=A0ABS4J2Q2_9BACL|nr:extracellular solute-binding protein [Paenibacillus eucommiae]MBP1994063.1 ABC-type glycerol-3-phosphate transport system substrate-binding protein [Paenibacillus eucommiae]
MKKKWFQLLLSITLVLSLLAACSSNTPAEPSASDSGSTAGTDGEAPKDYGKVYLYPNYGHLGNAVNMSTKETLDEIRQYIKEQTGVEVIEIVPPKGSEADRLNLLLAGNEPLDIYIGTMDLHQASGGAFPLNKLLDNHGQAIRALWPDNWSRASWEALQTSDGELWALPISPPMAGEALTIRKDWLDEVGLPVPTNLEEFEAVLKAFKEKDPVGNGETIPLITSFAEMNRTLAGLFMDNGYGNWIDAEGKVRPTVQNPDYETFVKKMADWFKKGYIYRESFSSDGTRVIELVRANRVGSAATWHSRTFAQTMAIRGTLDQDAEYVVADLQGPKGYGRMVGGVGKAGTMINKNAKNPEGAIRYINWLQSDVDNYLTGYYGLQGKHWEWVDKEQGTLRRLNTDYAGEFMTAFSFAMTVQFREDDPNSNDPWIRPFFAKYLVEKEKVKYEGTSEVSYLFETARIAEEVPSLSDVDRMIEQEITKFIMGARPLSEYAQFLKELEDAGINKWIDAYTKEYERVKDREAG